MNLGPLSHVGIATPSMSEAIAFWREVMGATHIHRPFDLEDHGVRVCFLDTPGRGPSDEGPLPGTRVQLLEPLGPDSPIARFLARNPRGGQHHLCFEVPDIAEARTEHEAQGNRILGPTRIGALGTPIFFLHPGDMHGLLIKIMETPAEGAHWSN